MFVEISLNKLSNSILRTFLEKYTDQSIPMETTLRKGYIDNIYNTNMDKMKQEIQQNKIWVSIDEIYDIGSRCYSWNSQTRLFRIYILQHSDELDKANHSTISKLFDKAMGII